MEGPMNAKDQEIKKRVEDVLRDSTRVDEKEVQVEVGDAMVVLNGQVDSAIEKRHARHLAEDVEGVKSVSDHMRVRNFVRRTDEELVEEVRHALLRDAFLENGQIEVYASSGEVRLDGTVPSYHTRKAAEDVTWWTPGVINVENLLLVTDEEFVDISPGEVVDA
jgi:osmotically-inducible protein OsmY